ncbi:MAG: hypothetical protein EA402_04130 [Planctomycetota bacterium]|nr:MAG: hypothetical protein EA402_04130 [Planctomycetota bacterium]
MDLGDASVPARVLVQAQVMVTRQHRAVYLIIAWRLRILLPRHGEQSWRSAAADGSLLAAPRQRWHGAKGMGLELPIVQH